MSRLIGYVNSIKNNPEALLVFVIIFFSVVHVYLGLHLYGDGSSLFQVILSKQITFLITKDFRPVSHFINEFITYLSVFFGVENFKVLSWIYGLSLYLNPLLLFLLIPKKFKEKYLVWFAINIFLLSFMMPINKVSEINISMSLFWISIIYFKEESFKIGFFFSILALLSHQAIMFGYCFWSLYLFIKKCLKRIDIFLLGFILISGFVLSYSVRSSNARNFYYDMAIQSVLNTEYFFKLTLPLLLLVAALIFSLYKRKGDIGLISALIGLLIWFFISELSVFNYHYLIRPYSIIVISLISIFILSIEDLNKESIWIFILIIVLQQGVILNEFSNIKKLLNADSRIAQSTIVANNNFYILPKCPFIERTVIYFQAHNFGEVKNKLEYNCGYDWAKVDCGELQMLKSLRIKNNACNNK